MQRPTAGHWMELRESCEEVVGLGGWGLREPEEIDKRTNRVYWPGLLKASRD